MLAPLGRPEAEQLARAVPPWLPFLTFANLMATCGEEGYAWRDPEARPLLETFCQRHLQGRELSFIDGEWLPEILRGLCDRVAKIFLEESFMDGLLASLLWAFSAKAMPQECQKVVWGAEDPALLRLLDRALPSSQPLFWRLEDYAAPEAMGSQLASDARTWPRIIAARAAEAPKPAQLPPPVDLNALE
ncbi:unnamed protein product [Effrenium voratum]|uniref:Uncharacterized protein n=1 Tax=Effrenium voratum TaxID=2562239 RepID=A0AA36NDM6_9DINO|nr:unnamed protein product [Effrenium voratum]